MPSTFKKVSDLEYYDAAYSFLLYTQRLRMSTGSSFLKPENNKQDRTVSALIFRMLLSSVELMFHTVPESCSEEFMK